MKRWYLINIFSIFLLLFMFSVSAYADQAERRDESFDFGAVKTVYVEPQVQTAEGIVLPEIDSIKIDEMLTEDKRLLKHFTLTDDKSAADITIAHELKAWGTQTYWQEPYTYIDYRTVSYIGSNGKRYYTSIPVTRYRPGYYYDVQYFSAKFTVTDNKSGKVIYERFDRRGDNKRAYAMFGRALRDFYRDFNSLCRDTAAAKEK